MLRELARRIDAFQERVGRVTSFIIIGFALLFLQGVSETIKNFYVAMGWEEPEVRVKEIH